MSIQGCNSLDGLAITVDPYVMIPQAPGPLRLPAAPDNPDEGIKLSYTECGEQKTLTAHYSSDHDGHHLVLGVYHIWVDDNDKLRILNTAPTLHNDGTIVGTQS